MSTINNRSDITHGRAYAFPIRGEDFPNPVAPGMTMRQWYAGMALQGLLANAPLFESLKTTQAAMADEGADPIEINKLQHKGMALAAFALADAMLSSDLPPQDNPNPNPNPPATQKTGTSSA